MKLKLRLTLWFLAISLIPMLLVMYFSYSMTRNALLVQIFNQLESLINVQQSRVESLISERQREVSRFADRPQLRALLSRYAQSPDPSTREILDQLLLSIQLDQPRYKEITLADLQGNVIASTHAAKRTRNLSDEPWFAIGRTQSAVSLQFEPGRDTLTMRVAGPLIQDEIGPASGEGPPSTTKRLVGVCLLVTDADALLNLAADRTGLGELGQFVLARRTSNGDTLVIETLRHQPDQAPRLRVNRLRPGSVGIGELTMLDRQVHEGVNFHGTVVYAATRHMGVTDWALVVTVDKDEATRPIHSFRDLVMWAMVALTLLTVLASFSLARSITEPLEGLTQAAQRAAGGDLSTRVPVTSDDELGILGAAFNQMSARLEASHHDLETKVAERTAELEAANTRLQQVDRMKSEFLATMSHELRTPLNSIMGFSEILLSEDGAFEPEQREQLRCIYGSARHLLKIIEEILEVSKIEAGQMSTEPQWFSLCDLVQQAADILRPQATQNRLQISLAKTCPESILVYSDGHKLLRVLVNLIGNAVKFTHQGGVFVTSFVEDGPRDGMAVIEVRDTGIGIRPSDIAQLFQPFKQIDSGTRRQYEGTGLGLYYSKKVVELLGGSITVHSVWQGGTTFTIRLPVRPADAPARPQETEFSARG